MVDLVSNRYDLKRKKTDAYDDLDIRDNLKQFVLNVLKEDNITPYELSRRTGCNETLWKNFLDGRTKMPDSGAIVALADYAKVSLNELVGIERAQEIEQKLQKKSTTETKIPASIAGLSPEAFKAIETIKETTPSLAVNEGITKYKGPVQQKSFVEQERAKRSNKSTEKSR